MLNRYDMTIRQRQLYDDIKTEIGAAPYNIQYKEAVSSLLDELCEAFINQVKELDSDKKAANTALSNLFKEINS